MNSYRLILVVFWFFFSIICQSNYAQIVQPEARYKEARDLADKQSYVLALRILTDLLADDPNNFDYKLLIANVYAWSSQYQEAIMRLQILDQEHPNNSEVLMSLVNVLIWNDEAEKALPYAESAIQSGYGEAFSMKKAQALVMLERDEEAMVVLRELNSEEAELLRTSILQKKQHHIAFSGLLFTFPDSVERQEPWRFAYMEYGRKGIKLPFVIRMHWGKILTEHGAQLEVDLYPKVGKRGYMYLNTSILNSGFVFPSYRGGVEYYHAFEKNWEASIGGRYLYFGLPDQHVYLATAHLAKTIDRYQVSYRTFVNLETQGTLFSHIVNIKYNEFQREGYYMLDLQYGSLPFYFINSMDFVRTSAIRLGFHAQVRLKENYLLRGIFFYEYEEFMPDQFRDRNSYQLILIRRF